MINDLHIPTVRRVALKQFKETGRIETDILDLIMEDWGIDLSKYKDANRARELQHNLVKLYLLDPESYDEICALIKYKVQKHQQKTKPSIPDIVA